MRGRKPSLTTLASGAIPADPPECPPVLDEEARAEWQRMVAAFSPGILAAVDRAALACYCQAWSRWVRAEGELKKGEVVRGGQGNAILNPWLSVSRQAMQQMRSFLSEFGLTPVSRHRLLAGQNGESFSLEDP